MQWDASEIGPEEPQSSLCCDLTNSETGIIVPGSRSHLYIWTEGVHRRSGELVVNTFIVLNDNVDQRLAGAHCFIQ
jgi:hypothetical protein